jgi:sortase (surface protein transpeptidase)
VLLIVGGGTAVGIGLLEQQPAPPAPQAAGSLTSHASSGAPSTSGPATPVGDKPIRPVELQIPSIGVRSRLTVVGLNPDGTLAVPKPGKDYDKAAWFNGSPTPGQIGPAVIEGHVDGKVNGPSVFYRLGSLKPGRRVEVRRADGSQVHFVVYAVRLYPKNAFPTQTVYGNTTRPELRLITCGGPYDKKRQGGGYPDNVVVFAYRT